jgi:hypothetical protein
MQTKSTLIFTLLFNDIYHNDLKKWTRFMIFYD